MQRLAGIKANFLKKINKKDSIRHTNAITKLSFFFAIIVDLLPKSKGVHNATKR